MSATTDRSLNSTGPRTRRALLAGVLGGLGAAAAAAVGRVSPVRAEGETMVVGGEYTTATSRTLLRNKTTNDNVFQAESQGTGIGIAGYSAGGTGAYGISGSAVGVKGTSGSGVGVFGDSTSSTAVDALSTAGSAPAIRGWAAGNSTAVFGYSGANTQPTMRPKTGVFGYAEQDVKSRGVIGVSPQGQGVRGETLGGVGVYAVNLVAAKGYALRANGGIRIDKGSGKATIPAGDTVVWVSPSVHLRSQSLVLLSPLNNLNGRDLWFTVDATNKRFGIHMSSARGGDTRVAWLVLG